MYSTLRSTFTAASVLAAAACATPPAASLLPARFTPPVDQACIKQLETFVSQSTGRQVTLSEAAFVNSDELVVTSTVARDAAGRPLDGRQLAPVLESFRLAARGGVCVVSYTKTKASTELVACRCEAAATPK